MQILLPTTLLYHEIAKTFFTYEKVQKGRWKELKSLKSHHSSRVLTAVQVPVLCCSPLTSAQTPSPTASSAPGTAAAS